MMHETFGWNFARESFLGPLWVHLYLWFLKFNMTLKTRGQLDTSEILQNASNFWVCQSPGALWWLSSSGHCSQWRNIVLCLVVLVFVFFRGSDQNCFGIICCSGCQAHAQKHCWHKPGKQSDFSEPGRNFLPIGEKQRSIYCLGIQNTPGLTGQGRRSKYLWA